MSVRSALTGLYCYGRLFRNPTLLLLWAGQIVSTIGDAFFNLAVMWIVYAQSGSPLQTAFVQAVWHLDRILFGPIAGLCADLWDRKRIMVTANVASGAVVGVLALLFTVQHHVPVSVILLAVFLLNTLNTFSGPAGTSLLPDVVGNDLLATASGLFSTIGNSAALAGVIVAALGTVWAVAGDAVSFLAAALCLAVARFPVRAPQESRSASVAHASVLRDIRDGWRVIADRPVVRAMVWLGLLVNGASFLGPLYPALVRQRLHGGAAAFGAIEAAAICGSMVGGVVAGALERRYGAGSAVIGGWGVAGFCLVGMAVSSWLPLTILLMALHTLALVAGGVSMGALTVTLIPDDYRGRVWGMSGAIAVLSIPPAALIGGWLADIVGAAPMFAAGGGLVLGVAALAWSNPHVRDARI